jgi:molybdate transport system regulatory protein
MPKGLSARNCIEGQVTAIQPGAVNAEVVLTTPGGDSIVAVVTLSSVKALNLAVGKPATAIIKAPWVIVQAGAPQLKLSARNQLAGTVKVLQTGAVNSEVTIQLPGGSEVYAVVTNEAISELGLKAGVAATALIKSSHVILGVPN